MADLADWLTDAHHRTSTDFGSEALAAVSKALLDGDDSYAVGAYRLVCSLRERNSYTFGQDIPAKHADCGRDFRCVLESLQDALLGMMEARGRGR